MRAIVIAVGSELLRLHRSDTNSLFLGRCLEEAGIWVDLKLVVPDDREYLAWVVKHTVKRAQLLVLTGGLGPTEDDITREAVAQALRVDLEYREELMERIQALLLSRGVRQAPAINSRQAFLLSGAEALDNPLGTAPGQWLEFEGCRILLLPGPPAENQPMFRSVFQERIRPLSQYHIARRQLLLGGISEAEADSMMAEEYRRYREVDTTLLAGTGLIEVHLLSRSRKDPEEAEARVEGLAERLRRLMAPWLLHEGDSDPWQAWLKLFRARGWTVATAESCTGGLLGHCLTQVPGASEVYMGGVVSYANDLKLSLLGVRQECLDRHGAVSMETAREMARGIRARTGARVGVGISGIAGPGGGRPGKPEGLVFVHVSAPEGEFGVYRIFPAGDRDLVKQRAVTLALTQLLRLVQDKPMDMLPSREPV